MHLHWHRRDLRPTDNVALAKASAASQVVPVFVLDDRLLAVAGRPRIIALLEALDGVRDWYRDRGSDLVVERGDPRTVIPELAATYEADAVTWNRDYSRTARSRDAAVRQALDEQGVTREAYHDAVCHPPGSITTTSGDNYSVFSYYFDKWADREKQEPLDAPAETDLADVSGDPLPDPVDLVTEDRAEPEVPLPNPDRPTVNHETARERLDEFCSGPVYKYATLRDTPAADGTSRLSADLSFGTIGVRTVYEVVREARRGAQDAEAIEGVTEFTRQLAWREFYVQALAANPTLPEESLKPEGEIVDWTEPDERFAAWKAGETGYPIVDAGMRQLLAEGWMHNRVRMIVASFLTKDLLIHWQHGYRWFRDRLIDHDTANNAGGWQWAASTGLDAQPYFRVFNPMTQGERHDPDGEYITQYVPELAGVEPDVIHTWDELTPEERKAHAPDFPDPIVDHAEARERAIEAFETARESTEES